MKKPLLLLLLFIYNYSYSQDWVQMGETIIGVNPNDKFAESTDLSSDGNTVIVGSPFYGTSDRGLVKVFSFSNNTWFQKGTTFFGSADYEYLGLSVSISDDGNTIAIGAPRYNNDNGNIAAEGRVGVYQWQNSNWVLKGQFINGTNQGSEAGWAVSLSSDGNTVAVGMPYHNAIYPDTAFNSAGQVCIYGWDGSEWLQLGNAISGSSTYELSGSSVKLSDDGDIIIIGAYLNSNIESGGGVARIYKFHNGSWEQMGSSLYGATDAEHFGYRVSTSSDGHTIAITGSQEYFFSTSAGQSKVFYWDGEDWVQKGNTLGGGNLATTGKNSISLSSDGNTVAIGASGYSNISNSLIGQIRIYEWSQNNWIEKGSFINGEGYNDMLGISTCLSSNGQKLAVGARGYSAVQNRGRLKVFEFNNDIISVNQNTNEFDLKAYPIPASSTLQIQSQSFIHHINLIDLSGRVILSQSISPARRTTMDVQALSAGVYLLQVQTDKGTSTTRFVVE